MIYRLKNCGDQDFHLLFEVAWDCAGCDLFLDKTCNNYFDFDFQNQGCYFVLRASEIRKVPREIYRCLLTNGLSELVASYRLRIDIEPGPTMFGY